MMGNLNSAESVSLALDSTLATHSMIQQSGLDCGEKIPSLALYDKISLYSLIGGFALLLIGIVVDNKALKRGLISLALLPLGGWGYVNFGVDYAQIERNITNYNLQAEATLANIAEAQDRYKSEQDTFLNDLKELESHLSGAHGIHPCVKIVELNVTWDHWSAVAQHVSSPETVQWDSTSGSSLKKG